MTVGHDMDRQYYVYMMTNANDTTLYVGMTNDLARRVYEHKKKLVRGFTQRYNLNKLVHFEEAWDARSALEREKVLKGWTRAKKVVLIETANPRWNDLSDGLDINPDDPEIL